MYPCFRVPGYIMLPHTLQLANGLRTIAQMLESGLDLMAEAVNKLKDVTLIDTSLSVIL